jgi:hypothetical protein
LEMQAPSSSWIIGKLGLSIDLFHTNYFLALKPKHPRIGFQVLRHPPITPCFSSASTYCPLSGTVS